jgi:hypothetical protein
MSEMGSTIEQDIVNLEQQLKEKKAALQGAESETKPEKELLREAIGERIQKQIPDIKTQQTPKETEPPSQDERHDIRLDAEKFVNIVFEKSIEEGIREVVNTKNPALIDAFHDLLVDEMHDKMVESGILDQVK